VSLISIIIPCYNEEENLRVLYERVSSVMSASEHDFEVLFIDDGSSDNTFGVLRELSSGDNRIRVISMSRNFGSHAGCLAGLIYSRGDAVTFLSADLQDPPELILRLVREWLKGYDVVIGIREWKNEKRRIFPAIYYHLVRKYALQNMPEMGTDVFLVDRKVVSAIKEMREKNTSIFGLILWSGFRQTLVSYEKGMRYRGVSKWTPGKKIKLFIDTFVSFSYFPIRIISVAGIVLALTGFVYAIAVIANRLFLSQVVEGWTSLMVVLLLVSGVQMLMLGVVGEYLWRSFDESRKRPVFIVDKMIGFADDKP
jgi:dolichol-phosphate mannosyltransferase